ncbi:hypothetical protein [Asticcacaulis endophyticus]|uniref:Uncharacterized protein n=1 Tax=Asticcacaulis endophyticus TaxID=1395890 RepID=A0A918PTD4_9CAUL|nr:hypothetical protein [Asticcacaulis endophyticus]GGZ22043.1 hypothetical protein GCM10011273_03570 [Asticcacaulis endophyticus]
MTNPKEWKIVPCQPTPEMIDAAVLCKTKPKAANTLDRMNETVGILYASALNAAPPSPFVMVAREDLCAVLRCVESPSGHTAASINRLTQEEVAKAAYDANPCMERNAPVPWTRILNAGYTHHSSRAYRIADAVLELLNKGRG